MKKGRITVAQFNRLQRMAIKAMDTREAFEKKFRELSEMENWQEICNANGMHPSATSRDWLC